ncbi:serine hydrolase, partial [Streptomyces sp. ID05-39B]|nr:serine hydrolase [Streptomyces sp. ID05-39B]
PPADLGRYTYSNTNYVLLGLVVEQVTGRSYATGQEREQRPYHGVPSPPLPLSVPVPVPVLGVGPSCRVGREARDRVHGRAS